MDEDDRSRPTGRFRGRHKLAAVAGASALLGVAGANLLSGGSLLPGAGAEPIDTDIAATCVLGTSSIDVTVPLTVDDKVDPVPEGGRSTLETRTGLPSLPVEVTINELVVTTPIPTQIASTDAVTFSGGNLAGSAEVVGSDLVVTFTGPVSSSQIQVPTVVAEQTVATGTGSPSIDWKVFARIDADTNYGMATCTPKDPNLVVNATTIVEASAPTTEPPTTEPPSEPPPTDPSTPPTTEPPPATPPPPTTTPPSTTPPSPSPVPGLPTVPGVPGAPAPPLPVPPGPDPALPPLPTLPAPPSLPTVPSPPPAPTPSPAPPCPGTGLPPLPVIGCPAVPVPPAPPTVDPDIDIDVGIRVGVEVGIGF